MFEELANSAIQQQSELSQNLLKSRQFIIECKFASQDVINGSGRSQTDQNSRSTRKCVVDVDGRNELDICAKMKENKRELTGCRYLFFQRKSKIMLKTLIQKVIKAIQSLVKVAERKLGKGHSKH